MNPTHSKAAGYQKSNWPLFVASDRKLDPLEIKEFEDLRIKELEWRIKNKRFFE